MIQRLELLNALEDAPVGPLAITAWRHMFGHHLPDQENNRGARWNPPGVAAIYLSYDRTGVIAEGDHAIAIQPIRPRARRKLYTVTLTLEKVINISSPAELARIGLTADDIANDDMTACQEVGAAAEWLAHDGLIVPSARSPSPNLVIYPAHRASNAVFEFDSREDVAP